MRTERQVVNGTAFAVTYDPTSQRLGAVIYANGLPAGREVIELTAEELTEIEAWRIEEVRRQLTDSVQAHLDATARQRGYDGILSLCSYAGDPDPVFAAEAQAGRAWRSAVWRYCYQVLADCLADLRAEPTEAELIAELPPMVWP